MLLTTRELEKIGKRYGASIVLIRSKEEEDAWMRVYVWSRFKEIIRIRKTIFSFLQFY